MFTDAQLKRIREIGWAVRSQKPDFTKITGADVALLSERVDALDSEGLTCASEIVEWAKDRVEEDLRQKREWLQEAIEQMRCAELMVREAEAALSALSDLTSGGLYERGGEINSRWDAVISLYQAQHMLPEEPVEEPSAPAEAASAPPSPEPPKEEPKPPEPRETRWGAKTRGRECEPMTAEEQDVAMLAALKTAAGDKPEIQVSLAVLAAASGVPTGSTLTSLRRLQDSGEIEIIPDKPETGAPRPNIYRFVQKLPDAAPEPEAKPEVAAEAPPEPEAEPPAPVEAVPAHVVAGKLSQAWGASVTPAKRKPVQEALPLRDRILDALGKGACTTSGLASMLDFKELAVCQTLDAMKHEGTVSADEMPEAGRRAQLWRLPVAEPSPT